VWEKGPVRCGHLTRADGVQVPVWHESEVAAIAFMLQRMLIKRGFLDAHGNQVPAEALDRLLAQRAAPATALPVDFTAQVPAAEEDGTGAKCPECGARALRKVDGCTRCTACHYLGACA
jgi:ribonucleoside-diphosphate reductase alpha chain